MEFYRAGQIESLTLKVGASIALESLRLAVAPPYIMVVPFIESGPGLKIEAQNPLEEDGVHGCVYQVKATGPGQGEIVIGFRDLRSGEVTHSKRIPYVAR